MAGEKSYGQTPPLSMALPSEADKRSNEALIQELRNQGTFEAPPETQKRCVSSESNLLLLLPPTADMGPRYRVLASLQQICDAFVKKMAKEREPNNAILIRDARGKIFTYGSFRLGVFGPGSDIDTLVVVPRYVTREDYFKFFPDLLTSMSPPGAITDLTVVTDAFVPIIKFEYSGISIDLIFSRIATLKQLPSEKDFSLKDNNLLRGLDEQELRSLNGTRVTDEILTLVPEQSTFKLALRAIKLWAQRRAIYANIMGYPGGVAWAMMVARVCQLYPKANSAMLIVRFFSIMSKWRWPQAVMLKNIEDGPLQVRVWNPQLYKGDSFHLMPVITPAYPSMCATYNITHSAKRVIIEELTRADSLSQQIIGGQRPWKDLFAKHSFFTQGFKYYLMVNCCSTDKESHKIWSGYVESKVRVLVQGVERHESIALARPFTKGFERVHKCKSDADIDRVKGGDLSCVIKEVEPATNDESNGNGVANGQLQANDTETSSNGNPEGGENGGTAAHNKTEDVETMIYTTTHYIGLELHESECSLDSIALYPDGLNLPCCRTAGLTSELCL
jgi:poly(A) polymerase